MVIFDLFKKKKYELGEKELKWNKMWDLYIDDEIESPYRELMTYQSEVNNGGHCQYFSNIENIGDLKKELSSLEKILSLKMNDNVQRAYKTYLILEDMSDDEDVESFENIIEECDNIFYDNEEEINNILREYASKLEL